MSTLIHWPRTRRALLDLAEKTKAHKFTKVSSECQAYLEFKMKALLSDILERQPSVGKTIYPPVRMIKEDKEPRTQ